MIARILCSLLLCCIPFAAHAGAVFQERGDAGDFASPQDVVGTSIERIQGSIGGDDSIDVFRFHFAGGPLAILARLDGFDDEALPIRLVRESGLPDEACFVGSAEYPPNPCISEAGWTSPSTCWRRATTCWVFVRPHKAAWRTIRPSRSAS